MPNEPKSNRNKLLVAAGLLVLAAAGLFLLTKQRNSPSTPPPASAAGSEARPAATGTVPAPRLASTQDDEATPGSHEATSEPPAAAPVERDHTGEPIGAGPAKMDKTPPKQADPTENIPTKQQTDDAFARILARIDEDIAQAKADGDDAKVRRLEVRKARVGMKRRIKMAEERKKAAAKPAQRPDTPPRPPEE